MIKDKVLGVILAIYPVLCIYASPILIDSLGLLVLYLIVLPLLLLGIKKTFLSEQHVLRYLCFLLYTIFITIVWRGLSDNVFMSYIINGVVLLLLLHEKDYLPFFLNSYVLFAFLFSIFIYIQAIALYIFGIPIDGLLPFLPTVLENATSMRTVDYVEIARISSVFLEPSHFSLYVIPALAVTIWDIGIIIKRKLLLIIIFAGAIIVSTSGNGLVLLFIMAILFYINKAKGRRVIITTIIASIIFVAIYYFASKSSIINYTTGSLFTDNNTISESKSYYRVQRGFELFADLPFYSEIMGVGFRNAENFCITTAPELYGKYRIGDINFEYFNSVAAILIYFGIIGFVLIVRFFMSIWKKSTIFGGKALIILIVASGISSSIFNSDFWFLDIVLLTVVFNDIRVSNSKINKVHRNEKANIA